MSVTITVVLLLSADLGRLQFVIVINCNRLHFCKVIIIVIDYFANVITPGSTPVMSLLENRAAVLEGDYCSFVFL